MCARYGVQGLIRGAEIGEANLCQAVQVIGIVHALSGYKSIVIMEPLTHIVDRSYRLDAADLKYRNKGIRAYGDQTFIGRFSTAGRSARLRSGDAFVSRMYPPNRQSLVSEDAGRLS